jgi:hypothetical protein
LFVRRIGKLLLGIFLFLLRFRFPSSRHESARSSVRRKPIVLVVLALVAIYVVGVPATPPYLIAGVTEIPIISWHRRLLSPSKQNLTQQ